MGQSTETMTDQRRPARQGETWNDHWKRKLQEAQERGDATRGDRTKPPQPDGTTPLERDERPINQSR
jgi:hypothetical protein